MGGGGRVRDQVSHTYCQVSFHFDMGFCFGIHLAPYAVFSTRIYLQHIARPVKSDRPINIVFVRPSVHSSVVSL